MWLPWILLLIIHLVWLVNSSNEGETSDAAVNQAHHRVDIKHPPMRAGMRRLLSAEGFDLTGETFQNLQERGALGMPLILIVIQKQDMM